MKTLLLCLSLLSGCIPAPAAHVRPAPARAAVPRSLWLKWDYWTNDAAMVFTVWQSSDLDAWSSLGTTSNLIFALPPADHGFFYVVASNTVTHQSSKP